MALESHLYPDADTAEYAVDVSSVVHDTKLLGDRPADLGRFYALIAGLVAYAKNDDLRIYAVADWSLVRDRRLTDKERSTLLRWHRRGRLELADTTGQMVVSADYFRDYVPRFPWIAGNRDRFLLHVPDPGGSGVTVEPRVMPIPYESEISRKLEEHELLAMGLYDRRGGGGPRRELLSRLWRCPEPDCPLFGPQEHEFQPLPRFYDDAAHCPEHRHVLEDVGGVPRRVQIKVRVGGVVRRRFLMRAGQQVAVGRAPGEGGIALAGQLGSLERATAHQLSRAHVLLKWTGWKLTVLDTSRNGTRVRPPHGQGPDRVLVNGESARVKPGEEVVLVEGLELLASGREFAFAPDSSPGARDGEAGAPAAGQDEAGFEQTIAAAPRPGIPARIAEVWLPPDAPAGEPEPESAGA
jgi:hypothetical protein